jgi:hypothetical protein
MTTFAEKQTGTAAWPMFAVAGAGISTVLCAVGTFWDLSDNEPGTNNGLAEFLPVVAVIAIATALVFGLVVRTARPENAARRGLVLAIVGLLSIPVFWTGLPVVFAAAAVACATLRRSGLGIAALLISALTVGLAVFAAIAG